MSNTTFVDGTTTIVSSWLNDVNDVVYDVLGDGTNVPTTTTQIKTNLAINNVDNTSDATKNAAAVSLTNKTINLGSNTITGTKAQFDAACSDGNFLYAGDTSYVSKTSATGSAVLPTGTTAERDGSPSVGYFRYNTTNSAFEGYNGSAWAGVGGASGGGGNPFVYENDITVSADYTLTTNKNGMSAGPITIASGVTVTIPSGSVWTVV